MGESQGQGEPPTPPVPATPEEVATHPHYPRRGSMRPPKPGEVPFVEGAAEALDDLRLVRFYVKHTDVGAGGKEIRLTYVYSNYSDREHRTVPLITLPRRVQPNLRVLGPEGELLPVLDSQTCRLIHKEHVETILEELHAELEAYLGEPFVVLTEDEVDKAMGSVTRADDPQETREALEDAIHTAWGVYKKFRELYETGQLQEEDDTQDEGAGEEDVGDLGRVLALGSRLVTALYERQSLYLPVALLKTPVGPCYPEDPSPGGATKGETEGNQQDTDQEGEGDGSGADSPDPEASEPRDGSDSGWPPVTLVEQFIHVGDTEPPPASERDQSWFQSFRERHLHEAFFGQSLVSLEFPLMAEVDSYHLRAEPVEGTEFVGGLRAWNLQDNEQFDEDNEDDTGAEVFSYEKKSSVHLYRTGDEIARYEREVRAGGGDYRDHLWTYIQVQETGALRWLFQFCWATGLVVGLAGLLFFEWAWMNAQRAGVAASLLIPTALAAVLTLVGQSLPLPFSQRILPRRLLIVALALALPFLLYYGPLLTIDGLVALGDAIREVAEVVINRFTQSAGWVGH